MGPPLQVFITLSFVQLQVFTLALLFGLFVSWYFYTFSHVDKISAIDISIEYHSYTRTRYVCITALHKLANITLQSFRLNSSVKSEQQLYMYLENFKFKMQRYLDIHLYCLSL